MKNGPCSEVLSFFLANAEQLENREWTGFLFSLLFRYGKRYWKGWLLWLWRCFNGIMPRSIIKPEKLVFEPGPSGYFTIGNAKRDHQTWILVFELGPSGYFTIGWWHTRCRKIVQLFWLFAVSDDWCGIFLLLRVLKGGGICSSSIVTWSTDSFLTSLSSRSFSGMYLWPETPIKFTTA